MLESLLGAVYLDSRGELQIAMRAEVCENRPGTERNGVGAPVSHQPPATTIQLFIRHRSSYLFYCILHSSLHDHRFSPRPPVQDNYE